MRGKGAYHLKIFKEKDDILHHIIMESKKGIHRIDLWKKTGIARDVINKHLSRMTDIVETEDHLIWWKPNYDEWVLARKELNKALLETIKLERESSRVNAELNIVKTLADIGEARMQGKPYKKDPSGDPLIEEVKFLMSIDHRRLRRT